MTNLSKQQKHVMLVIWYNPDIDRYEKGLQTDYAITSSQSKNLDRFEVLHAYDISESSKRIADKVIMNLNQIRHISSTSKKYLYKKLASLT